MASEAESTELSVPETHPERTPLADLRANAMSVPVETMQRALAEFVERDTTFRAWLLSQLTEGVHFGFPPGVTVSETDQRKWVAKPSLYKSGAERVVLVMGLRAEFDSDMQTWEQLGKPTNTFFRRCRLFSRSTGELIGEGSGARQLGEKKMTSPNASIKMANKAAQVDAVLNIYGLSDLFTQDTEDRIAHENPVADANAPTAPPREDRVALETVTALGDEWKSAVAGENPTKGEWTEFVAKATGRTFGVFKVAEWTKADVAAVRRALGIPQPEELPPATQQENLFGETHAHAE